METFYNILHLTSNKTKPHKYSKEPISKQPPILTMLYILNFDVSRSYMCSTMHTFKFPLQKKIIVIKFTNDDLYCM